MGELYLRMQHGGELRFEAPAQFFGYAARAMRHLLANRARVIGALTLADTRSPIIGSSGAVWAIVGAYLALFPRARLGLVLPLGVFLEFVRIPASLLIGFWVVLQIVFTWVGPEFGAAAWWTHIAGFLLGIVFALVSKSAIARRLRN